MAAAAHLEQSRVTGVRLLLKLSEPQTLLLLGSAVIRWNTSDQRHQTGALLPLHEGKPLTLNRLMMKLLSSCSFSDWSCFRVQLAGKPWACDAASLDYYRTFLPELVPRVMRSFPKSHNRKYSVCPVLFHTQLRREPLFAVFHSRIPQQRHNQSFVLLHNSVTPVGNAALTLLAEPLIGRRGRGVCGLDPSS